MSTTTLHFPVLRSLRIAEYQLFPGVEAEGFAHKFSPGVTVIVGVNGLGKTTMLNMVFRSLVGFYEPVKFDPYDPTGGSRRMVWKDTNYFSERTMDDARTATVTAEFVFGEETVRVVRRLDTLSISELRRNGDQVIGNQEDLQQSIVEVSGAGSLYDFFFVVRSLIFFLEDKVSLIWNPRGQFEIFRILLLDTTGAQEIATQGDQIRRLDSKYRNQRVHYNKAVEALEKQQEEAEHKDSVFAKAKQKRVDVNALEQKEASRRRELEKRLSRKMSVLEKREKNRLELEQKQRHREGLIESFFSRAFPELPAIVSNVLNHLIAGNGCLVCGTKSPKSSKRFRALAVKGTCPFCETRNVRTERKGRLSTKAEKEIRQLDRRVENLQASIQKLDEVLAEIERDLMVSYKQRSEIGSELQSARAELEALEASLPLGDEVLNERRRELAREERSLLDQKEAINTLTHSYSQMLDRGRQIVSEMATVLTQRFEYYAGEFLVEKCRLSYDEEKRRLGEEGELLNFPNFHIEMTSATSPQIATARKDYRQVSESQKEFVDLAFRMALFDAVRLPKESVMLVIETPEASLDSIFVKQAGNLLRKFAEGDRRKSPNVVIASCNLDSANMVRSLLGIENLTAAEVKTAVSRRLINLLEVAAPTAAITKFGAAYAAELRKTLRK
jgi:DNA repair exonuclease SbcCD ATPase subunit